MIYLVRAASAAAVLGVLLVGCNGSGGPRKVVINEQVCANARFLRLDVGKAQRMVVDDTQSSPGQNQLTLRMVEFPMQINGEINANSKVGNPNSTLILIAHPGETVTQDVVPRQAGSYVGECGIIVGGRSINTRLQFEIVE